jgi:hypothetical protein
MNRYAMGFASLPSPREAAGRVARRSFSEGERGGGCAACAFDIFAPHPRPLPAARKSARGEGSMP